MKNRFDLVPGNPDHYRLIPGKTDHYRLLPGQAKYFQLMPADAPQFTLLTKPKASPIRGDRHNRQIDEIRRIGEEAKSAVDQLSAIFVFTEDRVERAWAAAQVIRRYEPTMAEEARQVSSFHKVFTQQFLQRVLAVIDAKSNAILAKIGHKA